MDKTPIKYQRKKDIFNNVLCFKVLDRYILTRFLINFFSAFLIIILIFVFHTIWLYIDEFAGKGISIWIILKFISFMIPNMIPIILPLTVVLSSIMTMGAFAESYEFAAMKASGISLLRASRVLIVFMLILSFLVFFTTNYIQPLAHKKADNLRENVKKVQPSAAISEGIFTEVNGYYIKVHKKTGDRGQYLHDIIIHQIENDMNTTVIKAENGELIGEGKGANILQLVLKNGTHYKDVKNEKSNLTKPFTKTNFQTYTLSIDVSQEKVDFDASNDRESYKSMTIGQLSYVLDSVKMNHKNTLIAFGESLYRRTGIGFIQDSNNTEQVKDTIRSMQELEKLYKETDYMLSQTYNVAKDNNASLLSSVEFEKESIEIKDKIINVYTVTLSDKFALAFTCFVLFFVAAPLGAFIRKGGIGMPLVVAVGLFLSYYFLGMFTKSMANTAIINPIIAPWVPTMILLPLGIYLTIKINSDSPIFQIGETFKKILSRIKRQKNK